jgi:putative hemolysin
MEQHLQNAGVLIFFPAGEVSRPTRKGIRDKKWHSGFIKLASKLRAPLLPVHIQAHNSLLFYASTLVSPTLSMLLLMQQMFRRRHSQLPIKIGQQIAWHHWFSATLSSREMAEQCRQHVMRLGKGVPGVFKTQCAIARPEDRATAEARTGAGRVWAKPATVKPSIFGSATVRKTPAAARAGPPARIAFRAVEEGGKRRDTDSYDDDYLHLILWDEEDLEIVGAYRFMPTAMQVEKRGVEGLYSYSLFHYDDKMQDVLEHGIELGRSFIQPRYWGRRGLDYLWSGIGAYLARYPHYRYLFGPVSISGGLPPAARDLLVAFYRLWFPATHPLAASRQPYPHRCRTCWRSLAAWITWTI